CRSGGYPRSSSPVFGIFAAAVSAISKQYTPDAIPTEIDNSPIRKHNVGTFMDLLKKLQIKPGYRLQILRKPRGLKLPAQSGPQGLAVLLFAEKKSALHEMLKDKLVLSAEYFWVAYPKGSSGKGTDLNRDILAAELKRCGFDSVRLIAIDSTWSAMRFKKI